LITYFIKINETPSSTKPHR